MREPPSAGHPDLAIGLIRPGSRPACSYRVRQPPVVGLLDRLIAGCSPSGMGTASRSRRTFVSQGWGWPWLARAPWAAKAMRCRHGATLRRDEGTDLEARRRAMVRCILGGVVLAGVGPQRSNAPPAEYRRLSPEAVAVPAPASCVSLVRGDTPERFRMVWRRVRPHTGICERFAL
jgi:hypothetical protein